jgi:hypothetical protein
MLPPLLCSLVVNTFSRPRYSVTSPPLHAYVPQPKSIGPFLPKMTAAAGKAQPQPTFAVHSLVLLLLLFLKLLLLRSAVRLHHGDIAPGPTPRAPPFRSSRFALYGILTDESAPRVNELEAMMSKPCKQISPVRLVVVVVVVFVVARHLHHVCFIAFRHASAQALRDADYDGDTFDATSFLLCCCCCCGCCAWRGGENNARMHWNSVLDAPFPLVPLRFTSPMNL